MAGVEPTHTTDLLVVGGGPAGSAAAITGAKAGCSVLLVDKASFPRDKCCGDGLTTLALRLGEHLGLDPNLLSRWQPVADAVIHSPSGRSTRFPLPSNDGQYAAIVPRQDYDMALLSLAREAGAEVVDGHEVTHLGVVGNGGGATVEVAGLGSVWAKTVVAADGMWSTVRRNLGLSTSDDRGQWHAFRQYVSNVSRLASDLHIWFEPDLLPGYAWSFPLPDGRANLGFGVLRGGPVPVGDTGKIWDGLMDRPSIRAVLGDHAQLEGRRTAWPIPAKVDRAVLDYGPVLFVGDAAAATDALTGEGIGQALMTGILAAEAATAGGTEADIAISYREAVQRELVADHRMSVALQKVLARPFGARAAVRLAGLNRWSRRNFARWMFEDYPRALIATPHRWKRGALSTSGAYTSSQIESV
ncbi:MAG: geranylgeranyl reductase family protein [Acidimicrobiales bacterium]|nr:geranylgeranyl reductase family protein [Acidimicrobiales bacterium]